MNCDQAFDAMTDPRGRQSAELQLHLKVCPRCAQMRETLAPALEVLQPARLTRPAQVEQAASEGASPAALRMARRVAERLTPAALTTTPTPRRETPRAWGYVLAACCGALVAIGTLLVLQPPTASPTLANQCHWQHRDETFTSHTPRALVLSCVQCHL